MSDPEVLKAVVAGASAVCVALLGLMGTVLGLLLQTRRHAKRADEQVSNNHDTNLREESDVRHAENLSSVNEVAKAVDRLQAEFRGMRRDVGRLWSTDVDHAERLTELEHTIPKGNTHDRTSDRQRADTSRTPLRPGSSPAGRPTEVHADARPGPPT